MADRISLGAVWEETAAFVRAEASLLLPVAFAGFGLPLILIELLMPQQAMVAGQVAPGPWMWGFLPFALLNMIGSVAISALALRPGISVREAIASGLRAVPTGLALVGLALAAVVALSVLASIAAGVEQAASGHPGPVFVLALLLCLVAMIAVLVRVLPLWAVLAQHPARPVAALRRAFALTRRAYLSLLLLRIVSWIAQILTILVVLMPIAVVLNLVCWAIGTREAGEGLTLVAGGAVVSAVLMVWTVYVARLTRRLELSISGM